MYRLIKEVGALVKVETKIHLNKFVARDYQRPLIEAFNSSKYTRYLLVWPRRAGKDICAFNLILRAALKRVGLYYYLLPTAVQARRVMFDGITIDGQRIMDYIPPELITGTNIAQMKINLVNGSIIQFCGSNDYDALRGTNPVGVVFSEYAYQHPQAYPTLRPVLAGNGGFALFVSTPFGENHFFKLYEIAKSNPEEWFYQYFTVRETEHISEEQIQNEIESGEISPDMAQQEYYCDFSIGALGSYYSKYLINMELNNQVGIVDWQPNLKVHSAWDLGMSDMTCILMFQVCGNSIYIIDMYTNSDVGLEHYINVLQAKPYTWGKHIAPHDVEVRDFTAGGLTRMQKAAQLGFRFTHAPHLSIIDGIEAVRTTLPRIHIDQQRCRTLIAALRNYRKEYNSEKKTYNNKPLHDDNSHICDALRYLCLSLPKIKEGSSAEDLNKKYAQARYGGDQSHLPSIFRNDLPNY
jgi:phage terminase large subunit